MPNKSEVFATLSGVDVRPYVRHMSALDNSTEKLLPYLPWQFAHQLMLENYPDYEWSFAENPDGLEVFYFKDGTAEVRCLLSVGESTMIASKSVTSSQNKAYANPSADDIHNAKMRCRVRALAELGLGWDLWINPDDYCKTEAPAAQEPVEEKAPAIKQTESASVEDRMFAAVQAATTKASALAEIKKIKGGWKNRKLPMEELEARWKELCTERGWKNGK
jgi:hypothetical protein